MLEYLPTLAFLAVMGIAAFTDLRSKRIPNNLVIAGLVLGLATRATLGWAALASGAGAALVALVLGVLLFSIGAMGAGDGKLMAVVGAFLGFEQGLLALGLSAVAGAVLSLALAIRSGVILPILLNTRDLLAWLLTAGRRGGRARLGEAGTVAFPFGVAIAIGSTAAWFGLLQW